MALLNTLEESISGAVLKTNPEETAGALNAGLTGWIRDQIFPLILGILIFGTILFVFYGTFLYFTAYGDEARAAQAKKTITYAFIGFLIAAVAFGATTYVRRVLIGKESEQKILNELQPGLPAPETNPKHEFVPSDQGQGNGENPLTNE